MQVYTNCFPPIENHISFLQETLKNHTPSLLQKIGSSIYALTLPIFEKIAAYFSIVSTFLSDIFWPYEEASSNSETDSPSFMLSLIQNSLEYSKEQKIEETKIHLNPTTITAPLTSVFLGINYGVTPFFVSQNPCENFLETALTVECIQNILFVQLGKGLNVPFLHDYELLPTGDPLDRALYQGLIVTAASSLDFLSSGKITTPLHVAVAILTNLPFVQKRVLNLPVISDINDKVHTFVKTTREKIKTPLANRIKPLLIEATQKTLSLAVPMFQDNPENYFYDESDDDLSSYFTKTSFGKIASNLVQGACEQVAANVTNTCFDALANNAADCIIDRTINFGKETFRLASFNQVLVKTASNLPILGGISLIIEGGTTQTMRELIIRVAGATIFLTTGSSFFPLLIIKGPNVVNFFVRLSKRKLKKIEWADGQAIDYFNTLKEWMTNKITPIQPKKEVSQAPLKISTTPNISRTSTLGRVLDIRLNLQAKQKQQSPGQRKKILNTIKNLSNSSVFINQPIGRSDIRTITE